MHAFLCNLSACEALRRLGDRAGQMPRWPQAPRKLPRWGDRVSTQKEFTRFASENDLTSLGISTSPVDLLVPSASGYSRGKRARFHVWKNDLPTSAFLRMNETTFVSSPEFVLVQMAAHNTKSAQVIDAFVPELRAASEIQAMVDPQGNTPYDDPFSWARKERIVRMALLVCEFAGTYRLPVGTGDTQYELPPLTSRKDISAYASGIPHLYGGKRIEQALNLAFDYAASPMEAALALMLTLPVEYGGYGLPRPVLNERQDCEEFAELWDGGNNITPDLLWKDAHLVVEYDSNENHAARGPYKAAADATRANVLTDMGYVVLRVTTGNVTSLLGIDRTARQVAARLGAALDEADDITLIRRHKLHALLMSQ